MSTINNTFFSFLFILFSTNLLSQNIEEVIVKGNWRETKALEEDSSVVILNSKIIKLQPIKHFENLSYLVPNLNFAASDSRARHFQIRGIGERSQYAGEGGPIYYVGTVIDDIDVSGIGMGFFIDDVKQIEIYQGPQSFAYGHNAMAGLINIKTIEPKSNKITNKKLTIGNDKLLNASYFGIFSICIK